MVQVLISTMYLKDPIKLLNKMNIQTDAIIIDQCDYDNHECISFREKKIDIYHTQERGISKSRNLAIKKSTAKYIIFADDDFEYSDKYDEELILQYKKYSDADIIIFGAVRNDNFVYKKFPNGRLLPKYKYNINSIRITANRVNLLKNKILFDENFGPGSNISYGEDTIFITDCFKKKIKIYSSDFLLCTGIKDDRDSTWWHGYNEKYFIEKGMIYRRISKHYFFLMIYFLLTKHSQYKSKISFSKALKLMIYG